MLFFSFIYTEATKKSTKKRESALTGALGNPVHINWIKDDKKK